MSETPAAAAPPSLWRELLKLANEGRSETLIHRLLDLLCEARQLDAAALYVEEEGGPRRRIASGDTPLPELLEEDARLGSLHLGEMRLVWAPAGSEVLEEGGQLVLALASAARAFSLKAHLKRQRFAVNYRGVELEALYDVGLAIASTLDLDRLGDEVLLRAVSLLDARRGALYLRQDGDFVLDRTFGGDAEAQVSLADRSVGQLLDGKEPESSGLLPGARHLLVVPIQTDGEPRGLLVVADKESRTGVGPFPSGDRRTLSLFANQAAIALENARLHREALEKERLERELDLAADIQRQILPTRLPEVDGFELMGWNRPARHVGGDYYDMRTLEDGRLALAIADVAGKGMPAALLVSTLHSALRLLETRAELGDRLLERLNQHILDSSAPNKFITLLLVEVDSVAGNLRYVNAGHNPALLVRDRDGGIEELPPGGLPLGLFAGGTYAVGSAAMQPGDLLCMFSDGITECESPDGEELGAGGLGALLRERRRNPLAEIVRELDGELTRFSEGGPQADDQTIVLLRRASG